VFNTTAVLCCCRYGFVVYSDPNVVDVACAGLNGLKMGDRTLTVRRAAEVRHEAAGSNEPSSSRRYSTVVAALHHPRALLMLAVLLEC
jgi:splicing factor U2AF subunit